MFGPEGLRLVRVTDVSLLVEWESVRGAEYYILKYHPKGDERALQQVVPLFPPSALSAGVPNRKKIKPVFHTVPRFRFPTQRIPTSSQDCPRGSPTWSRCTLSSKEGRARQTGLKLPQVSSLRTIKKQKDECLWQISLKHKIPYSLRD